MVQKARTASNFLHQAVLVGVVGQLAGLRDGPTKGIITMFNEYVQRKLSVIPIESGSKAPMINDWQKYCREFAPPSLLDAWERLFANKAVGLGLCLGPASGIIAVDIDVDSKEIMDLIPPSPVRKRGKKGETRFFRYRDGIESRSFPGLDLLSTGRQTVLPPTIHPDTNKPYVWITPDTLFDIQASDLPELDLSFLSQFVPYVRGTPILSTEGRNNKLKSMITAMRGRGEAENKIIEEIYLYDKDFHEPRLFTDPSEQYQAKNEDEAKRAAWTLVNNVTKSLLNANLISFDEPTYISEEDVTFAAKSFQAREFPKPDGLVRIIYDYIYSMQMFDQKELSLAGAIACSSALLLNRVQFRNNAPNLYILSVAPTSSGKSFAQNFIKKLFLDCDLVKLIGAGAYRSSAAVVKGIDVKRQRLDLIDEVSSVFRLIKDGGAFQADIPEILSTLWSDSSGTFIAPTSAGTDQIIANRACVSILGSTTPSMLIKTVNADLLHQGLFPRFITFSCDDYRQYKKPTSKPEAYEYIVATVKGLMKDIYPLSEPESDKNLMSFTPNPKELKADPDADAMLDDLQSRFAFMLMEEKTETMRHFLGRAAQQITRLAMVHGALSQGKITVKDVTWAREVFEVSLHNMSQNFNLMSAENAQESSLTRVLNLIEKRGRIAQSNLITATGWLKPTERKAVLDDLIASNQIVKVKNENGVVYFHRV